jgi:hypothetical protein
LCNALTGSTIVTLIDGNHRVKVGPSITSGCTKIGIVGKWFDFVPNTQAVIKTTIRVGCTSDSVHIYDIGRASKNVDTLSLWVNRSGPDTSIRKPGGRRTWCGRWFRTWIGTGR